MLMPCRSIRHRKTCTSSTRILCPHPPSTKRFNAPSNGCGCHDYGFFRLRYSVYSGRRPLQTSQTDEKGGATVYMYNGGFHHSKIMMVDDIFCTVGTANLNSRSLRYDYETNAFIFNKEITGELNEMFQNDIEHCTQLTPEFWKKRSPWKKFVRMVCQFIHAIL